MIRDLLDGNPSRRGCSQNLNPPLAVGYIVFKGHRLQAMANGCVCVLADRWGSDEYLRHGIDSLRIPGREGKHWEYSAHEAFLAERYDGLEIPDFVFVQRAVEAIDRLMVDDAQMQGISDAARAAAAKSNSAEIGRKAFAEILRDIRGRMAR
jgi:glycosyltransferase involved in cell wall biosynthesis